MNSFKHRFPGKFRWLAGLAILVLLASQGCAKVPKPTSDSTPPTLTWSVYNQNTSTTVQINGSGTLNAKSGESYRVTLTANDPQGIHEITLGSNTGWQCVSGNIAQSAGPGLGVLDKQDLQPDSQNNVLTSIFLIQQANIGPFDCQPGFTFSGASVEFDGTGTNYFNGVTKGTLKFNVSQ